MTAEKRKTPPEVVAANDAVLTVIALRNAPCTASDVAETTGLHIRKVSAVIHHLVSSGRVFHVGERPISKHREVNLYSLKPPESARPTGSINQKQTWLSALIS